VRVNNIPTFAYAVRTASPKPEKRQNISFGANFRIPETIDKILQRQDFSASMKDGLIIDAIGARCAGVREELVTEILKVGDGKVLETAQGLIKSAVHDLPSEVEKQESFYYLWGTKPYQVTENYRILTSRPAADSEVGKVNHISQVSIRTNQIKYIPYEKLVELEKDMSKLILDNLHIPMDESYKQITVKVDLYKAVMKELLRRSDIRVIYTDGGKPELLSLFGLKPGEKIGRFIACDEPYQILRRVSSKTQ
jgi:hypothetical protein